MRMKFIFTIILLIVVLAAGYYFFQKSSSTQSGPSASPTAQSTTSPILQNDSEVIDKENTIQQSGSYDTQK